MIQHQKINIRETFEPSMMSSINDVSFRKHDSDATMMTFVTSSAQN